MAGTMVLAATELRLISRDWAAMVFAFAFPVLLMLILGGVFGTSAAPEYGGVPPDDYYVADYVVVPLGAVALVGLPVLIAAYREQGVLRRFVAAGVPVAKVLLAQVLVTGLLVLMGAATVLLVAAPVYGVPAVHAPLEAALSFVLGASVMIGLGLLLGLASRSARSAQALGLMAFFPMWLLGAGGPPRAVMPEAMRHIADVLPLGRIAGAVRESWLGTGRPSDDLLVVSVWLLATGLLLVAVAKRNGASSL